MEAEPKWKPTEGGGPLADQTVAAGPAAREPEPEPELEPELAIFDLAMRPEETDARADFDLSVEALELA